MSHKILPSPKVLHEFYASEIETMKMYQVDHPFFSKLYNTDSKQTAVTLPYYEEYVACMKDGKDQARDFLKNYEIEKAYALFQYRYYQNQSKQYSFLKQTTTPYTRASLLQLQQLDQKLQEKLQDPIFLEVYQEMCLDHDLTSLKHHEMIEVDYVKQTKQKVLEGLYQGVPIYLVGHLGSGKTQLAMEVAKTYQKEKYLQKKLEEKMTQFAIHHPNFTKQDAYHAFSLAYMQEKEALELSCCTQDEEFTKRFEPYFISGSHNLTYEDMFVEKTLQLSSSYQEDSFQEYLNQITEDFEAFLHEHEELLKTMSHEELLQLKIQIWKTCSQLFVAGNSSFGTIVCKQEKEILKALQEGKVVIVDEMNTIAMQNLIGLNDILQRHVGEMAYVTGVGSIKIEDGFAFIGTGNLSSQQVVYEGTNRLNPAFQSRFMTIEYQYLPNAIKDHQSARDYENDQLYRVLITSMLEEDGSLQLADAQKSLKDLYRLSLLARLSQNIFSGIYEKEEGYDHPPVLHEAVLSMRNLLRVLDFYQHGEKMDLSYALWEGFLSSVQNPEDLNYLMALAVQVGFFKEEDGWCVEIRGVDEAKLTYQDLRKTPYVYHYETMDHFSKLQVLELIFGPSAFNESYPKGFLSSIKHLEQEDLVTKEEYEQYEKDLQHFQHTSNIYKYLSYEDGKKES